MISVRGLAAFCFYGSVMLRISEFLPFKIAHQLQIEKSVGHRLPETATAIHCLQNTFFFLRYRGIRGKTQTADPSTRSFRVSEKS